MSIQSIVYKQRDLIFSGLKEIQTIDRLIRCGGIRLSFNRGLGSSKVSFQAISLLRINWRGKKRFIVLLNSLEDRSKKIPRGETIPNQVILAQRKNGVTISENKLTFNLRLGCKQQDVGSLLQKKSMIMFLYWKIWRLHSSRHDLTRCTCGLNDRRKFDVCRNVCQRREKKILK